jgi:hypothetical protein
MYCFMPGDCRGLFVQAIARDDPASDAPANASADAAARPIAPTGLDVKFYPANSTSSTAPRLEHPPPCQGGNRLGDRRWGAFGRPYRVHASDDLNAIAGLNASSGGLAVTVEDGVEPGSKAKRSLKKSA